MGYKAFWESDHHSDFRNTTQMCCRVPKELRASGGKESWRRNEKGEQESEFESPLVRVLSK